MSKERIFDDDPQAIEKLELKLVGLEKEKAYWKTIKKTVPRDYTHSLGDQKWYMPESIQTNIRNIKKRIDKIKARQDSGITLERKRTFKDGKPRFYYQENNPE